jgi:hypothetical protein
MDQKTIHSGLVARNDVQLEALASSDFDKDGLVSSWTTVVDESDKEELCADNLNLAAWLEPYWSATVLLFW